MYHAPENELVSWEASSANRVSFPSGTNGTEIVVHGDNAGDVTLTAHIKGYAGPSPICEAKVVPETTIPIHAFIICETGYASTNAAGIHSIVEGNWRQPFTSGAYQDTLSPVGFFIHANSNPVSN